MLEKNSAFVNLLNKSVGLPASSSSCCGTPASQSSCCPNATTATAGAGCCSTNAKER